MRRKRHTVPRVASRTDGNLTPYKDEGPKFRGPGKTSAMRSSNFVFGHCLCLLFLWTLLTSCAQAQTEPMPEAYRFEAKPILPVKIWTEWIEKKPDAPPAPGLQAGNIFEATIHLVQLENVPPRKTLYFFLEPDFNDEIHVRLQLPAPTDAWMPFERGDSVIVQVIDGPIQGKHKPRINLSIVRATDGSALHVLEGQSTLPEPFPEALSLVPRLSRIGKLAVSDRRFCARAFERHPMEMRRDGYDPLRLLPGQPREFELGRDVDGWVEVRDCLSTAEGTCPNEVDGQWICQAVVALRPSDDPELMTGNASAF